MGINNIIHFQSPKKTCIPRRLHLFIFQWDNTFFDSRFLFLFFLFLVVFLQLKIYDASEWVATVPTDSRHTHDSVATTVIESRAILVCVIKIQFLLFWAFLSIWIVAWFSPSLSNTLERTWLCVHGPPRSPSLAASLAFWPLDWLLSVPPRHLFPTTTLQLLLALLFNLEDRRKATNDNNSKKNTYIYISMKKMDREPLGLLQFSNHSLFVLCNGDHTNTHIAVSLLLRAIHKRI